MDRSFYEETFDFAGLEAATLDKHQEAVISSNNRGADTQCVTKLFLFLTTGIKIIIIYCHLVTERSFNDEVEGVPLSGAKMKSRNLGIVSCAMRML